MTVSSLNRSLDQELTALLRGASLECPVCGEFVMHVRGDGDRLVAVACLECRSLLAEPAEAAELDTLAAALPSSVQAG